MAIEFEADICSAAVDGRDFLYTAFQFGDAERARPVLKECFGGSVLKYAERAWRSTSTSFRIAQCDLAISDPAVVEAHYENRCVIAGRGDTIFRNAFLIELPILASSIISVTTDVEFEFPKVDYSLEDIR
jgi:hypothetical protein